MVRTQTYQLFVDDILVGEVTPLYSGDELRPLLKRWESLRRELGAERVRFVRATPRHSEAKWGEFAAECAGD